MNSLEKVMLLKDHLLSLEPEDEGTAQDLQMIASLAPFAMRMLPQDPEEVDRYLRWVAWAAARCRSDGAPPIGVFEFVEGEWRPVDVEAEVGT